MAKVAYAYADNAGSLYSTPEEAALADLAAVLGRIGAEAGITGGLARMILEKRTEIEKVFFDLDHMVSHAKQPALEATS